VVGRGRCRRGGAQGNGNGAGVHGQSGHPQGLAEFRGVPYAMPGAALNKERSANSWGQVEGRGMRSCEGKLKDCLVDSRLTGRTTMTVL